MKHLTKYPRWIVLGIVAFCFLMLPFLAFAQQQGALNNSAAGLTCAVSGSSTQIIAANAQRFSYSLLNDSAIDVRIGFLATGTPLLTDSNSFILKAGQPYADAIPGVYYGRIVCMSTTAVAATIHYTEASR